MEHGFEDRLRAYRDAAQFVIENNGEHELEAQDVELQAVQNQLAMRLEEISREVLKIRNAHPASPELVLNAEQEVKNIQLQKQQIMANLKQDLSLLDQEGSYQVGDTGGQHTRFIEGHLQSSADEINWQNLTVGELVTDREWGGEYAIDTGQIPRDICKKFLIERAKSQIAALLDEQILVDQLSNRFIDTDKEEAYRALLDERQKVPRFGHVAEVMIKNMLTKIQIYHGLDIEVKLGDVFDDVGNKIDFIIKRTNHKRGVTIQEDSDIDTFAVQVTLNSDEDVIERKVRQVGKARQRLLREGVVDDMALVQVGEELSAQMREAYRAWGANKKPGGPDKLLPLQTRESLFKLILNGVYDSEELNQIWTEVSDESEATN